MKWIPLFLQHTHRIIANDKITELHCSGCEQNWKLLREGKTTKATQRLLERKQRTMHRLGTRNVKLANKT